MSQPSALERAFELARSGKARTLEEIRACLRLEGHDPSYVQGKALQQQLKGIIRERQRTVEATSGTALQKIGKEDPDRGAD